MVGFIHTRVCIQPWVTHNPIDEVINNGGDVVYTPEPIVEGWLRLILHIFSFPARLPLRRLTLSTSNHVSTKCGKNALGNMSRELPRTHLLPGSWVDEAAASLPAGA